MCSRQCHPQSREPCPSVYHSRTVQCYPFQVGSICGLGPDLIGIHSISLAARYRVAACSSTLRRGLEKVNEARGHNCTPLFALCPVWERDFLFPSMTIHTANAFHIVCRLDRDDILDEVPQNKKQKVATGLLLDKLRTQDFAGPLSSRASRVLGPISRHRIVDILPHMKRVSRASRPGLLVGFVRILCNGLCTAQRFHTVENDHTCRIGCPDEPDSLTHHNNMTTKKLLVTRLDLPSVPVEPSIWYCGSWLS